MTNTSSGGPGGSREAILTPLPSGEERDPSHAMGRVRATSMSVSHSTRPRSARYRVASAGYNVWYTRNEFRYLWKRMSGDVCLAADKGCPDAKGFSIVRRCSPSADLDDEGPGHAATGWPTIPAS